MDYMDPDFLCPKKTDKLDHSLTHLLPNKTKLKNIVYAMQYIMNGLPILIARSMGPLCPITTANNATMHIELCLFA